MPNYNLDQTAVNVNSAINQIIDTSTDLNIDNNTLVVDKSTNRVGVGTASPLYNLHVSHPSTNVEFKLQSSATTGSGSSRFYLDANGNSEYGEIHFMHEDTKKACIWHHKDSILHFKTGADGPSGTGHLSIDASGNVRVDSGSWLSNVEGTEAIKFSTSNGLQAKTNSVERLRINTSGTLLCKGVVQVQQVDGGSNAEIKFHPESDDAFGRISWLKNNGSTVSAFLDHDSTNQDLRYFINDLQKFTIDSSGNVGIGSSSPVTKLQVNGTFSLELGYNKEIASGVIEIDHCVHSVLPESGNTDDLVTINGPSGASPADGQILVLRLHSDSHEITLKHGTGNLLMGEDKILTQAEDSIMLMYWSSKWNLISHSVNDYPTYNNYAISGGAGDETIDITNDGYVEIEQTASAQNLYNITYNGGNPKLGQIIYLNVDNLDNGDVTLKHNPELNGFYIGSDITLAKNGHRIVQLVYTGWAWSAIGHD